MSDNLKDWRTIKQAAVEIGITDTTLSARIRKGKIKVEKVGWNRFIHKDEVQRAKQVEERNKHANNKRLEETTR